MKILKLLMGILTASIITACSNNSPTIKIGISGPYTGAYAASGEQLWKGATQAIADINAAGGIGGAKLVAVKGDDSCQPQKAVSVAKKLVSKDKVAAVVGHFCSSSSIPASEIYHDSDILMITPASTNPDVTDRGLDTVMRVSGRDDDQGVIAGDYIADELNADKVVVIHDKDIYGKGLADATIARLDDYGVDIAYYQGIDRGTKDFKDLVGKIRSLNPEVVYFGGMHSEAGPLLRQLRDGGVDSWFVSGAGVASAEFVDSAGGPEFFTKTLMTFGADPRNEKTNPAGVELVNRFRSLGYEPEGYTLYAYATVQVIAAALQANLGETSGAKLSAWIKNNGVDTVMGRREFDAKGDITVSDYIIYRWTTSGEYEEL